LTPILKWKIPVKTVSEANCSEHWTKKKKRHDIQKKWVWLFFNREGHFIPLPCKIKLTRIGKKILDSDNLPTSMKWIRDAIADSIFTGLAPGRADDNHNLFWQYSQQVGKEYGVIVEFFDLKDPKPDMK